MGETGVKGNSKPLLEIFEYISLIQSIIVLYIRKKE